MTNMTVRQLRADLKEYDQTFPVYIEREEGGIDILNYEGVRFWGNGPALFGPHEGSNLTRVGDALNVKGLRRRLKDYNQDIAVRIDRVDGPKPLRIRAVSGEWMVENEGRFETVFGLNERNSILISRL